MNDTLLPVYQTLELPLKGVLAKVAAREWVLPAIQREFVWSDDQICRLFDSMMRGYPFGTFLFWDITKDTAGKFKFYEFMRNYHERDANTCDEIAEVFTDKQLTAVLDGQQRLTALNIGLKGSRSHKLPYKRRSNASAYPVTYLYLDLMSESLDPETELAYRFAFLPVEKAQSETSSLSNTIWFKVSDILKIQTAGEVFGAWQPIVSGKNIALNNPDATKVFNNLSKFQRLVHETALISCYREKDQDLEKVLDIFIRMNSGGTPLSKSDLLFSVAVANWGELDARKEVNNLVTQINNAGSGFSFSKDFVLKAGLMLSNTKSIGFKVQNFDKTNMQLLEQAWPSIKSALILACELVASFGFSGKTLRADSALLPIACYLHFRQLKDDYITSSKYREDRKAIRLWLIRSFLKASGIWGSGLDTLLTALRSVIHTHGAQEFPRVAIESAMSARGKSLIFTQDEIEDLADEPYGSDRTFALLSLLFDVVDNANNVHVDHVFPISRFSPARLSRAGIAIEEQEGLYDIANSLPNLQLLEGLVNQEKLARLPEEWITSRFKSKDDQARYISVHDLGDVPCGLVGFAAFAAARRSRFISRIEQLLK